MISIAIAAHLSGKHVPFIEHVSIGRARHIELLSLHRHKDDPQLLQQPEMPKIPHYFTGMRILPIRDYSNA